MRMMSHRPPAGPPPSPRDLEWRREALGPRTWCDPLELESIPRVAGCCGMGIPVAPARGSIEWGEELREAIREAGRQDRWSPWIWIDPSAMRPATKGAYDLAFAPGGGG